MGLYTVLYVEFATATWQHALLPIHFVMGLYMDLSLIGVDIDMATQMIEKQEITQRIRCR